MNLGQLTGPLLLFGGPYSNLPATQAIRAEAQRLDIPPSRVICTGDLIAYCASPGETVEAIRGWGIHGIMGNCEASMADESIDCGCGFAPGSACALLSDSWYSFADRQINRQQRQWMQSLPRSIHFSLGHCSFLVVHGAPSRINKFIFPSTPREDKRRELDLANTTAVIGGHCGLPFGEKIGQRYWLNTGVIGLPANDGTPDGWYMLLSPKDDRICVSWHRLPYDHPQAAAQMQAAGLNNDYISALQSGLWPSMDTLPNRERAQQGAPVDLPALWL
jgi:hypothetical protein